MTDAHTDETEAEGRPEAAHPEVGLQELQRLSSEALSESDGRQHQVPRNS